MIKRSLCILTTILFVIALPLTAKEFYRFKNADGNMIIKDQVTNEMIKLGYEVLNEYGRVIERVPPGKTLGEEEEERIQEAEAKKAEQLKMQQLRSDAELLRQFSSVGDIIRNRDAQLLALEQRIKIQESKSDLLKLQLEDQQRQAATHERLGQKLPKALQDDIAATHKQIDENATSSQMLEQEKVNVAHRFESDIVRFKELESLRKTLKKDNPSSNEIRTVVYDCPDSVACQRAWQLAQIYAKDNATGQIEIITNTLILTSKPDKDNDIALSFSRIPAPNNKHQIMFEVSCKDSERGVELCRSDAIRKIRDNFLTLVDKQI